MSSVDLSTTYLGIRLANPFMTRASPLGELRRDLESFHPFEQLRQSDAECTGKSC
jgi:hypothetical protein